MGLQGRLVVRSRDAGRDAPAFTWRAGTWHQRVSWGGVGGWNGSGDTRAGRCLAVASGTSHGEGAAGGGGGASDIRRHISGSWAADRCCWRWRWGGGNGNTRPARTAGTERREWRRGQPDRAALRSQGGGGGTCWTHRVPQLRQHSSLKGQQVDAATRHTRIGPGPAAVAAAADHGGGGGPTPICKLGRRGGRLRAAASRLTGRSVPTRGSRPCRRSTSRLGGIHRMAVRAYMGDHPGSIGLKGGAPHGYFGRPPLRVHDGCWQKPGQTVDGIGFTLDEWSLATLGRRGDHRMAAGSVAEPRPDLAPARWTGTGWCEDAARSAGDPVGARLARRWQLRQRRHHRRPQRRDDHRQGLAPLAWWHRLQISAATWWRANLTEWDWRPTPSRSPDRAIPVQAHGAVDHRQPPRPRAVGLRCAMARPAPSRRRQWAVGPGATAAPVRGSSTPDRPARPTAPSPSALTRTIPCGSRSSSSTSRRGIRWLDVPCRRGDSAPDQGPVRPGLRDHGMRLSETGSRRPIISRAAGSTLWTAKRSPCSGSPRRRKITSSAPACSPPPGAGGRSVASVTPECVRHHHRRVHRHGRRCAHRADQARRSAAKTEGSLRENRRSSTGGRGRRLGDRPP